MSLHLCSCVQRYSEGVACLAMLHLCSRGGERASPAASWIIRTLGTLCRMLHDAKRQSKRSVERREREGQRTHTKLWLSRENVGVGHSRCCAPVPLQMLRDFSTPPSHQREKWSIEIPIFLTHTSNSLELHNYSSRGTTVAFFPGSVFPDDMSSTSDCISAPKLTDDCVCEIVSERRTMSHCAPVSPPPGNKAIVGS